MYEDGEYIKLFNEKDDEIQKETSTLRNGRSSEEIWNQHKMPQ